MTHIFRIPVQNMSCGSCAGRVSKALQGVEGAGDITVNLADETAQIAVEEEAVLRSAVDVLAQAGYPPVSEEIRFSVSGMSCASCVARVDKALQDVPGVTAVHVNLADETALVTAVQSTVDKDRLVQAAKTAGYALTLLQDADLVDRDAKHDAAQRRHLYAVMVSAALALPVFVMEMGGHLFPPLHHFIAGSIGIEASWAVQFALTTAVLAGPGRQFFTKGFPALFRRAPTMDSLVALGAGSAWAFSTVALFAPSLLPQESRHVYFEAAAVIVTLILLGRWFEARAKGRTGAAIRKLVGLQPRTALVRSGSDWREVPLEELRVGQEFLLQPGARVPTDATVLSGESRVDESMITGEPMQVRKQAGSQLTGGSVNGDGSLICQASRVGEETTLAQIIRMVRQAQGARLPIQALVDQVTLWFVPAVIAVAVITVIAWLLVGPAPVLSYALVAGVSVLIIACPCAMGLATPTSIMVGTGRAAELGVLFRQGNALQSLSGVEVVAVDKTGTLTEGKPKLTSFEAVNGLDADQVLAMVAAVETRSEHPLAKSVVGAARERGLTIPEVDEIKVHSGMGISGLVDGKEIAVGNAKLMTMVGAEIKSQLARFEELAKAGTVFYAAEDGRLAAVLAVSDPVRSTSAAAIAGLKSRGLRIAMITGDSGETAQAVGAQLGIDLVIPEVLPEGKTSALKDLRERFGKVAFVGDGINDAPVLAEADVGIAIGTGTDVAIETADVVLMSGDLKGVLHAFAMSSLTLRNIRQNLVWAFGYNTLLIPVAAGVFFPVFGWLLSPALAAAAMAFSSVFVLGNALRLRRAGGMA